MEKLDQLRELAQISNVTLQYRNNYGQDVDAKPEALKRLLNALGLGLENSLGNVEELLQRQQKKLATQFVEPVYVVWDNAHPLISLRAPKNFRDDTTLECEVELEDGSRKNWKLRWSELRLLGEVDFAAGGVLQLKQLTLPLSVPLGYHHLHIKAADKVFMSLLISAPSALKTPPQQKEKSWGVFVPTYSLRSEKSWGSGDYSELERMSGYLADKGAKTVATLPLLPAFLEDWKCDPSPYSPATRLFWNDFYVDPREAPEWAACAEAQRQSSSVDFVRKISQLQKDDYIDYLAIQKLKRPLLESMAKVFFEAPASVRSNFEAYRKEKKDLEDYARFRATCDQAQSSWWVWKDEAKAGRLSAKDYSAKDERYHLYSQWLAHQQMSKLSRKAKDKGLSFYLDLPVGVSSDSYDVWREGDLYAKSLSAGAPPDPFFTKGQSWGFPPFHPDVLRDRHYTHFIEIIRHHLSQASILRIDHVMGLHRLFVVPQGHEATDGIYIRYRAEELYAILLLEAYRAQASIVGEDLGTVPDQVRDSMNKHRLDRLFVFQYEASAGRNPPIGAAPANSVASLNTHDMPMFGAYLHGKDVSDRQALGLLKPEDTEREIAERRLIVSHWKEQLPAIDNDEQLVKESFLRLSEEASRIVLVTLEDLWLEERPQNIPGTHLERPNWKRKLSRSFEEIRGDKGLGNFFDQMTLSRLPSTALKQQSEKSPLSDQDLYYFNEGTHSELYKKLGAQFGSDGVNFSVWAPDAEEVSVIGDFNGWNPEIHRCTPVQSSGLWQTFIPGLQEGSLYKFSIRPRGHSTRLEKADPFAMMAEVAPKTGSVLFRSKHTWKDQSWMKKRGPRNALRAPMSVYELHPGSWKRKPEEGNRSLNYREMAVHIAEHCKNMNFTHVELMPIAEHPFYGSWGYQVTGYFAPSSRYGSPDDFRYLVDYLHQNELGVILDWVPSHFPTDAHGLANFDGTALYEHADPRLGFHPDWKSAVFNYGRNEVRAFLISNACYWFEEFHIDGLRVDAVASMLYLDYSRKEGEWIPNRFGGRENLEAIGFLKQLNERVYGRFPEVQMIAEESTSWGGVSRPTYTGGLGFGMKWDMGWMHDTLKFFERDPIHRHHHLGQLTFRGLYAFTENFVLALSHDEVVHGKGSLLAKMPGDIWQKFANLRLLYSYMYALSGKKLLFMGSEIGGWDEWSHERSVDWHLLSFDSHQGVLKTVAELNRVYRSHKAFYETDFESSGFEWVVDNDAQNCVLAFLRRSLQSDEWILSVFNFTPVPRHNYRVGVPKGGNWQEIFNSDAKEYGGSGTGNLGSSLAKSQGAHGRPFSVELSLPPLGAVFLKL